MSRDAFMPKQGVANKKKECRDAAREEETTESRERDYENE